MKPLQLDLQGFTAFRQFTELDFRDLELFALVGPTGSGKSSLLDAITFALYGQTARLKSSGLDALISQGERGLEVALTFEVGETIYRASRLKGRKQAENEVRFEQQDESGRWMNLSDGGVRVINERIRKVLGLDFVTFTKSVILPQGQFAQVLLGSGKDRQQLLGELTGLDHVQNMQKVASEKSKELKHQSQSLATVLEGEYANVNEEAIANLRSEREKTDAEAERLTSERERLQNLVQRLRETEKVFKEKQEAERRLKVLESRAESVLAGAKRASQARKVAGVLPLLDSSERSRIAFEREQTTLKRAEEQMATTQQRVANAQQVFAEAQATEEQIPELEGRTEALRQAEADARRLKRAGGTPQTTHAQPLAWDEDAFEELKQQKERAEKNKQERTLIQTEKVSLEAARSRYAEEEQTQKREQAEQTRLERDGKTAKTELEEVKKALAEAQLEAGLASHRHQLKEGEACPLCLQPVQQLPQAPSTDLGAFEQRVKTQERLLDELRTKFTDLRSQIKSRSKWLDEKKTENADWQASIEQREVDLNASEALVNGDPVTDVQRMLASLAERVRQAGADPAKVLQQVQQKIAHLRKATQTAQTTLGRAEGDQAAAKATFDAASQASQQREQDWQQASSALAAALAALSLTAEQARQAGLEESEIHALEEAARKHEAQLAKERETVSDLDYKLGAAPFDPAELLQASRDATATEAQLSSIREQAGRLAEQEHTLKERLSRKKDIEQQAKAASQKFDTWQTLTNTLKANEFQQFLLAEIESQLLTRAGILLHDISDGRYRLTLQNNDYVVQDLWNAGEARGVKTLSGGETFLASLSLAIALSDYLAGNKILGALFLDEGFGTLDPQALEAVASALENLRTQGRMVGIVTHVESLSERLPSRLLITKSVTGSSVERLEG